MEKKEKTPEGLKYNQYIERECERDRALRALSEMKAREAELRDKMVFVKMGRTLTCGLPESVEAVMHEISKSIITD